MPVGVAAKVRVARWPGPTGDALHAPLIQARLLQAARRAVTHLRERVPGSGRPPMSLADGKVSD